MPRRSICELEIAAKADGTFLAMKGALRGRRRRLRGLPVHAARRPALRRRLLPTSTRSTPSGSRSTRPSRTSARREPIGASAGRVATRLARRSSTRSPERSDSTRWSCGSRTRSPTSRTSRRRAEVRRRQLCRGPAQGDGDRGLRRLPRAPAHGAARRGATSASASARSSSRPAGPASSPSGWAFPSTTGLGAGHGRAGRLGCRHPRPALARPGAPDHHRTGRRRQAGRPDRGGQVVQGDTSQTAYGSGTFGSRGAVIGYGAISRAAAEVARQAEADRRPFARDRSRGPRAA